MAESLKEPLHFIGIGGTGMCPLAELALARGLRVTGSDLKESSNLERLRRLGAILTLTQDGSGLPQSGTVIVSSAVRPDNAELTKAKALGLTLFHRSDLLRAFMDGKKAVTIAGTSGKTTVTAMIAFMLDHLGVAPEAAIGGTLRGTQSSALTGKGPHFIAEADESDGSFLKYRPFVSILTNIDHDHLDHYGSLKALEDAFAQYLSHTDPEGCAVIGWDNRSAHLVGSRYDGKRLTFGFRLGCDVRALHYECAGDSVTFQAVVEKDRVNVRLPLLGKHNVENALCALAVARALDLDVTKAASALEHFPGVVRRLGLVYQSPKVKVYDDYAHNPAKISACVKALRASYPDFKLVVLFQAHRYSRLDTMYNEICGAFTDADDVMVLPVYAAGEAKLKDFSLHRLASDIQQASGCKAIAYEDPLPLVANLVAQISRPTVFLTVGAGDVGAMANTLGESLNGQASRIEEKIR